MKSTKPCLFFIVSTGLCLHLFSTTVQAQAVGTLQTDNFTYIIMNDPQAEYWVRPLLPSSCDEDGDNRNDGGSEAECANAKENEDRAEGILAITDLGNWPADPEPDGIDNVNKFTEGNAVTDPEAIIINGDLVHNWDNNEVRLDAYELDYVDRLIDVPVLPGYGNHDYSADNAIASKAIDWMRRAITGNRAPNFPAYWLTNYHEDSLSYAWVRGNYAFIQMHNHPQYSSSVDNINSAESWLITRLQEFTAAGKWIILNSHYALYDTEMSTSKSQYNKLADAIELSSVVAHFHGHYQDNSDNQKIGGDKCEDWSGDASDLTDFSGNEISEGEFFDLPLVGYWRDAAEELATNSSGELAPNGELKNLFGRTIPMFQAGHAGACGDARRKVLLVEFGPVHMTVAAVHMGGGTPSWWLSDQHGEKRYRTWDFSTYDPTGTFQAGNPDYGFLAIGTPLEDINRRDARQNNAGVVDLLYWNDYSMTFGGRWTQDNLANTLVEADDRHGYSVAIGDFDNDGFPDLASGSPYEDNGGSNAGLVSIVYGTSTGLHGRIQRLDQGSYGGSKEAGDRFGHALAVGDFDGDGVDDLAISAPYEDISGCGDDAGSIHVFYGDQGSGLNKTRLDNSINLKDLSVGDCEGGSWFGLALAAGDFDNDGDDDLVASAPGNDRGDDDGEIQAEAGFAIVFDGTSNGIVDTTARKIGQDAASKANIEVGDQFGDAMTSGDFNGDGYDDLAVGSPLEDVNCDGLGAGKLNDGDGANAGNIFIFYGASNSIRNSGSYKRIDARDIDNWSCQKGVKFGHALAAGDFDRDGYDELAVGAPERDQNSPFVIDPGVVVVFDGRANGISGNHRNIYHQDNLTNCSTGCDRATSDLFGRALAAGDANRDDYDDLAIGVPYEDQSGLADTGLVHLLYGSSSGLKYSGSNEYHQESARIQGLDRGSFDRFGSALAITSRAMMPLSVSLGPDLVLQEGETTTLKPTVTGKDPADVLSYRWTNNYELGCVLPSYGGTITTPVVVGNSKNFTITPGSECSYIFTLKANDQDGTASSDQITIVVVNGPPVTLSLQNHALSEGDKLDLELRFYDPNPADGLTLTVDWGDGTTADVFNLPAGTLLQNVSHKYEDDNPAGTPVDDYTMTVSLVDSDGAAATPQTATITVHNEEPRLQNTRWGLDADGSTVTVLGTFTDTVAEAEWTVSVDWGDGSAPTDLVYGPTDSLNFSTSHTYGAAQPNYTVTVTVTDDDLGSDSTTLDVTVNERPKILSLSAADINEGETATLTGTMSDTSSTQPLTVNVDWGDGGTTSTTYPAGSTTFTETYTYLESQPLVYTVTATVNDGLIDSFSDTIGLRVANLDPVLLSFGSDTINEGGTATVTFNFTDPGVKDTHYFVIDWGYGAPVTYPELPLGSTSFSPSFNYPDDQNAPYFVNFEIFDDEGGSVSNLTGVFVRNVAPTLSNLSTDVINEGDTASISGNITDPGTLDTFTVSVDWGDGNSDALNLPAGSTGFAATHVYVDDNPSGTSSDDYTVSVNVLDDDSGSDNGTTTVTVNNVAPTLSNLSSDVINEGGTAQISADIVDPGTQDTFKVTIDWGDGSSEVNNLSAGSTGFSFTHDYDDDNPTGTSSDVYVVSVSMDDDDSGGDNGTTQVTVNNVAPVLSDLTTDVIDEGGTAQISADIVDPGTLDSFQVTVDWGDGNSDVINLPAGSTALVATHDYPDDNPTGTASDTYPVSVTVEDDDTDSNVSDTTVTVNNLPPVALIGDLFDELTGLPIAYTRSDGTKVPGTLQMAIMGVPFYTTGSYSDTGIEDSHDLKFNWGDGTGPEVVTAVPGGPGAGSVGPTVHSYATGEPPGNRTVTFVVTDDDTGRDQDRAEVLVLGHFTCINLTARNVEHYVADNTVLPDAAVELETARIELEENALEDLQNGAPLKAASHVRAAISAMQLAESLDAGIDLHGLRIQSALCLRSLAEYLMVDADQNAVTDKDLDAIAEALLERAAGDDAISLGDDRDAAKFYRNVIKLIWKIAI